MELDGKAYRINTDFRAGLAYSSALLRGDPIHVDTVLRLFFPEDRPEDHQAALAAISDFLRCGAVRSTKKTDDGAGADHAPPPYSFLTDAAAIQAEFQRVYGINLYSEQMHWWQFWGLLQGLITHSFSERVKFRLANLGQIQDQNTRRHWREMQQIYALDEHGDPVRRPQTLEEYNAMLLAQARGERW